MTQLHPLVFAFCILSKCKLRQHMHSSRVIESEKTNANDIIKNWLKRHMGGQHWVSSIGSYAYYYH